MPLVQRSINTQLHEVLGVEPARIVFGGFQTMDRFLLPTTIPGAVQQGIAAIPAKDRRLVVGEYVKHLVDTQAVITKCAQEYQHKYLKSRVRKVATSSTQPYKAGSSRLGACAVAGATSRADASNEVKSMLERTILHRCCQRVDSTGYPAGSD